MRKAGRPITTRVAMTIAHDLRLAGYGNTYGTAKTADFMLYIFVHILRLVLFYFRNEDHNIVSIINYTGRLCLGVDV